VTADDGHDGQRVQAPTLAYMCLPR